MRYVLIAALLLVACTQTSLDPTDLDPELHGTVPADEPNMPASEGGLDVQSAAVAYYGDVTGYLARPADGRTYPGVIMIHEWWGLNDNIRAMADELASEGYIVLAVDLYEGAVATTPEEARAQVSAFDQGAGLQNMRAAVGYLRGLGAEQLASLGWCFGGGQSLQLGIAEDLDATVIYYGSLVTDERLMSLEQPVLGIFAENDGGIPVSQVEEFDQRLDALGVENNVIIYPGVDHAFANPSGERYAPEAAEDAWQKTTAFLAANLKQ